VEETAFCAESSSSEFAIHTRWIETEFETPLEPWDGAIEEGFDAEELYRKVVVEVEGRRIKVGVPAGIFDAGRRANLRRPPRRLSTSTLISAVESVTVHSPMQATVARVLVEPGQKIAEGETLFILEAMKMEQPIRSTRAGIIDTVHVAEGTAVANAQILATFAQD
jgi:acetyl-CoA/propionyl-CoA carboxylase biotin carboxyl carrier protein